ncbi:EAL domain-containing protein [Pseudomonas sp. NEEL19]|uniref:putative bifunctional diguanylate cyclase/phosphodiesterase n=1 Tax=Pseudomonas sp. NEEL19 TaxID=2867409 RepID=UPI002367D818|nr:EAL domain-containing protein [Pseudomonas sp. NEEL19]WDM58258.1 EAL domain-containing protein [Pseudomonas sp. NEEL19]
MEWLGLQLFADLPATGRILLDCRHEPLLVLLAYVVACAACFATLDMAERQSHSEDPTAHRQWNVLGACCLAGGIWAMHFISMLAFKASVEVHYDLPLTILSLLIALAVAWLAMRSLDRKDMRTPHIVQSAVLIGMGIVLMHFVGMAAMQTGARQYYQTGPLLGAAIIAPLTSLLALHLARNFRNGSGTLYQAAKYGASLLIAAGMVASHFTAMSAMTLVIPSDTALRLPSGDNSLQLALGIGFITLLISGASISAALADKKLQSKEHDLRRVSVLLSELDQARASLQQAAHYDALTNLVNRRGFNQLFAERLAEHLASESRLAVMFLDIDHFKRINDSLGHHAGDELLKVIANHIKAATRSQDLVARFGGDEFCVVTSLNSRDEARHLAQRIMQRMKDPIELCGRRMVMTTSIGVSIFPDDGSSAEELLKHADLALYQSKDNGRNSLNFFNDSLKARASIALQLEEELRLALLEERGLCVHYQPIFDQRTGRVAKLEALVRWQHPQHGLLGPDRFIGIAETNGLIVDLDLWVLRHACADLALLQRGGHGDLKVTVNCSAVTLSHDELPNEVEKALFHAGVSAQQLELEVTENALMGDIQRTVNLLKRVRALGVALSIDDFGTGYSSLAYLKHLPLDVLKIDRTFLQGVPASQKDREIVQAIIVMAHTLHLQVVSEGVETEEQRAFLADHACDYLQGFLLGRPMPWAELQPMLGRLQRTRTVFTPCCDTALPGSPDLYAGTPGYRAGASVARRGH